MIFEVFLGFLAIFVVFLVIGFGFRQWFFVMGASIVLFLFAVLLWSSTSVDFHTGNTIQTNYTVDTNDVINSSSQQVVFNYEEIEGFNKNRFAFFSFLISIAVLFMSFEYRKNGGTS